MEVPTIRCLENRDVRYSRDVNILFTWDFQLVHGLLFIIRHMSAIGSVRLMHSLLYHSNLFQTYLQMVQSILKTAITYLL